MYLPRLIASVIRDMLCCRPYAPVPSPPGPCSDCVAAGVPFTVSDAFTDIGHGIGSHWHAGTPPKPPPALPVIAAEVSGFFGDEVSRGLAEFDVAGVCPAFATAQSAELEFGFFDLVAAGLDPTEPIGGLYGQGREDTTYEVYLYTGNCVEELIDYNAPATPLGTFDVTPATVVTDTFTFVVPVGLLAPCVGIRIQLQNEDPNSGGASFDAFTLTACI